MLDFSDKPYRYFPPRRLWPTTYLIHLYNRYFHLPRAHRITGVEVAGNEALSALRADGARFLFLPNHSTHSDAPIWIEGISQMGMTTQIMAAYDVFLRGRFDAWIMQRLGAFSVDRDASDTRAMTEARSTIVNGKHALTIFPEGNVYLRNDRVTPFQEGAALLGLRAAKDLSEGSARVWAVPVSIKATHTEDCRPTLEQMLNNLADAVDAKVSPDAAPTDRLRQVGIAALRRNLIQRGIDVPKTDDLGETIRVTGDAVLGRLESTIGISARPNDSPTDRVRAARRQIHKVRLDPDREADHSAAAGWADQAMLAFRIISYETDYVATHPTLDRFAETVEKLAEDIFAKPVPPIGPRHAFIQIGNPMDMAGYLDRPGTKLRDATRVLTTDVELAVQQGLDHLNAQNPHLGSKIIVQ